ncbi:MULTISPECIES: FKBP-type peptidyl-prolyl cis-trans isomerase N-terminal domain-containing protein [Serratia]|jgi:FKBP-type peptidyl-prolyl cis-trans isomerase FkpA|uniref:FKBP-type peptidyl-prolyl cis-trans isomerase N-terminal domain-containing protein n=1 Tax=Serratia TaxID=613 RepID=UPI00384BBF84
MSRKDGGNLPHIRRLAVLLPLLCLASPVYANSDSVPALLQFAEHYRNQQPATKETPPAGKTSKPSQPDAGAKHERPEPTLRQALKQRDLTLAKQQDLLREQEDALTALRQRLKEAEAKLLSQSSSSTASTPPGSTYVPIDFAPLQQLLIGLRKAVSEPPDAKRTKTLIAQARRQVDQERATLTDIQARKTQLQAELVDLKSQLQTRRQDISREQHAQQDLQRRLDDAQAKLDEKTKSLTALQLSEKRLSETKEAQNNILAALNMQRDTLETTRKTQMARIEQIERERTSLLTDKQTLQKKYDNLQQKHHTAEARHAEQAQTLARLETENGSLRTRGKWLVKPENLTSPETRQAYAAGSTLGQDIITLLDERKAWGVNADRQTVLTGIIDAFSGQYQLAPDLLRAALAESEDFVNTARATASLKQQKRDEAFIANFKKQKGVKQSPSGFWYRMDYVGDNPIAKEAVVSIVVKESMTDGTVIQDMDLSGNMLSQPVSAYPPLFREAIGQLRNHGTLTMVVPPSLAYGEAGYPPNVPPNATMVYTLRIENTEPASGK